MRDSNFVDRPTRKPKKEGPAETNAECIARCRARRSPAEVVRDRAIDRSEKAFVKLSQAHKNKVSALGNAAVPHRGDVVACVGGAGVGPGVVRRGGLVRWTRSTNHAFKKTRAWVGVSFLGRGGRRLPPIAVPEERVAVVPPPPRIKKEPSRKKEVQEEEEEEEEEYEEKEKKERTESQPLYSVGSVTGQVFSQGQRQLKRLLETM